MCRLYVLLLFAIIMALEACSVNCPRTLASSSIVKHRRACSVYKATQAELSARRHARATAVKIPRVAPQVCALKFCAVRRPLLISCSWQDTLDNVLPPSPLRSLSPEPIPSRPATPPSPPRTAAGRPRRSYRLPARFEDVLPEPPAPIVILPEEPTGPCRVILHVRDTMRSACNRFGLFREYPHRPSYDPDSLLQPEDLANVPAPQPVEAKVVPPSISPAAPWPFRNMSIYRLMHWANSGSNSKSEAEVTRLVSDVLTADDFRSSDLAGFNAHRENKVLDNSDKAGAGDVPWVKDGWKETAVDIEIPSGFKDKPARTFSVPSLHHRSLVQVIRAAFAETMALQFHLTPFIRFRTTASGTKERVYDEVYASDAWLEAHNTLQKSPREFGCRLERVIAGLMWWSDSTHLANFGTAKAWPLYLYFANLSKYVRARPTSGACHQVAYFPSLPDTISDFIATFIPGKTRRRTVLTHCRRELMHQVWKLMLDDEFIEAYEHGIVIHCIDGVWRRVYPRIFTYSADYPEKVLLATIRDKGYCPCPRCLVPKKNFDKMGLVHDLRSRINVARIYFLNKITAARNLIYKVGLAINNARIDTLLQEFSLVPTLNAFGERLGRFGFDFHPMLVVDHLHEWSLGVWKATFAHIVRVLYAAVPSGAAVDKLNARFRQIPSFGRGTVRRFCSDASQMKKLAGHNYDNLLVNIIPCIEGLLPEPFNSRLMTTLFRMSEWNAFSKLRMHTDTTLGLFADSTTVMGRELRSFAATTQAKYKTTELPGETASRARRGARKKAAGKAVGPPPPPQAARGKFLNLLTYKFHALGDYVATIRFFGTTDSYSTQTGELAHRVVKRLYGRTNKNNATKQMVQLERRETRIRRAKQAATAPKNRNAPAKFSDNDGSAYTGLDAHHYMSKLRKDPIHVLKFVQDNAHDPAAKRFIPKLKEHLLSRLLGHSFDGDEAEYSEAQRSTVKIIQQTIFPVQTLRVNFTTYDMRRDQDVINPRSHPNIMVLSPETAANAHPFWYAQVLGIFHLEVLHTGSESRNGSVQHMEFLWVRWYGTEPGYRSGFKAARLPKIGFVPDTDEYAFGFLDPSLVLRGCHIVPAFAAGRTSALLSLGPGQVTAARPDGEMDDWENFYVIIWVDRDMFMRYLGDGLGHLIHRESAWQGTNDAEVNDLPNDDADSEATNNALQSVADETMDVDVPNVASLADEEEGDSDPDSDDGEDSDMEGEPSSDEEGEGEDEGEGSSDDDDDNDAFDDEGFLDI
ncbi:hypothetical protein C8R44DRAFT_18711 [Mycena epipterygia]|nr:hypothetical protein C8R44DRAFT_18711 [Mycena epipterygia]